MKLFRTIGLQPFTRGLPDLKILRNVAVAKIFKRAIACGGISSSNFGNDEELKVELEKIWRNGWLHAEESGSEIGVEGRGAGKLDGGTDFVFAGPLHRWWVHNLSFLLATS